ncbi:hypothetical protein ACFV1J_01815, partial [Streptomyces sp. NPDC059649]
MGSRDHNSNGFREGDDGAVFGDPGTGAGLVSDYETWDWKQIAAAINGMSAGVSSDANAQHAASVSDPASLQNAAVAFYQVQQVLSGVTESLQAQAKALAGENGPWKGDAADAFLDMMNTFSRQVKATAEVLSGGAAPTGSAPAHSVPQQLADNAANLRNAQIKIAQIDNWYANQAVKMGVHPMSNGLIPISKNPKLVEMMTNDMRAVLKSLVSEYQVTIDSVRSPNTINNPLNGPTPDKMPGSPPAIKAPGALPNVTPPTAPQFSSPSAPAPFNAPSLPGGGAAAPFPGGGAALPDGAAPFPGGGAPLPGSAAPFPGGTAPLPDGAAPFPGGAAPFPGGAVPLPGGAAPLPGSAAPFPGGTGVGDGADGPGGPNSALPAAALDEALHPAAFPGGTGTGTGPGGMPMPMSMPVAPFPGGTQTNEAGLPLNSPLSGDRGQWGDVPAVQDFPGDTGVGGAGTGFPGGVGDGLETAAPAGFPHGTSTTSGLPKGLATPSLPNTSLDAPSLGKDAAAFPGGTGVGGAGAAFPGASDGLGTATPAGFPHGTSTTSGLPKGIATPSLPNTSLNAPSLGTDAATFPGGTGVGAGAGAGVGAGGMPMMPGMGGASAPHGTPERSDASGLLDQHTEPWT